MKQKSYRMFCNLYQKYKKLDWFYSPLVLLVLLSVHGILYRNISNYINRADALIPKNMLVSIKSLYPKITKLCARVTVFMERGHFWKKLFKFRKQWVQHISLSPSPISMLLSLHLQGVCRKESSTGVLRRCE